MRLLVLEGASLAIPEAAIASVEPATDPPLPWLAELLYGVSSAPAPGCDRRTLRLRGGGAVDVPAAMHLVQDVEILALSGLLRLGAGVIGIIGIIELQVGLSVVCDPRELVALGSSTRAGP